MNGQRTFVEDLKHQYKHGGMTIRLIFINVAVFLLIKALLVFGRLVGEHDAVYSFLANVFSLETSLYGFITHPWGLVTSIFAHFSVLHILFNMIFLFFTGRIFEQLFDSKRLLYTYILGGVAGGLFEILSHLLPALSENAFSVVGASGGIMAIFFAIAFFRPKMKVYLFGVLPVQIIVLAAVFFLLDFFAAGMEDGTAHFAHIGGAIIGMASVQNLNSSNNIITVFQNLADSIAGLFRKQQNPRMKVHHSGGRTETDEQFNTRKTNEQEEINRILDKISKSGYESLTKKEKDFLFNQSKK